LKEIARLRFPCTRTRGLTALAFQALRPPIAEGGKTLFKKVDFWQAGGER
jgi:hypothetical protein